MYSRCIGAVQRCILFSHVAAIELAKEHEGAKAADPETRAAQHSAAGQSTLTVGAQSAEPSPLSPASAPARFAPQPPTPTHPRTETHTGSQSLSIDLITQSQRVSSSSSSSASPLAPADGTESPLAVRPAVPLQHPPAARAEHCHATPHRTAPHRTAPRQPYVRRW